LAADICSPDVSVDSQDFRTSVTFDVSNQNLPDGATIKLTLDKNLTYSAEVKNNKAVFNLDVISAGQHSFVVIVRGQGLCTYRGKDSTLTVPDAGQGSRTSVPWYIATGPSRAVYCIQDPNKGSYATKDECEAHLRSLYPTATSAPKPSPPCDINAKFCVTALGKISTDPAGFVSRVFGILLSLAGGIALLLIIISGYRLMSSQGNPEKVQAAREQLTSAIVGLLFIIFSLAILTIIGVDILRIPGFTR